MVELINPLVEKQYPKKGYKVRQAVGIDTSDLFVARTGVRGSNDLVWVGRAANIAAKLCSLRRGNYASWATASTYNAMSKDVKYARDGVTSMWEARTWNEQSLTVYCSTYYRGPS